MNIQGFTATQAAQIIGSTQRTVIDWGVRGFIAPGVKESTGQGDRKVYSAENLVLMSVLKELFAKGLTRDQVEKLLDSWKQTGEKRKTFNRWFDLTVRVGAEWLIVIDNEHWFMSHDDDGGHLNTAGLKLPEAERIPAARSVIAINLTAIKKDILQKLN